MKPLGARICEKCGSHQRPITLVLTKSHTKPPLFRYRWLCGRCGAEAAEKLHA